MKEVFFISICSQSGNVLYMDSKYESRGLAIADMPRVWKEAKSQRTSDFCLGIEKRYIMNKEDDNNLPFTKL